MATIFTIILLITLGFFIWGVIAPNNLAKRFRHNLGRRHFTLWFGGLALICFVVIGITAPPQTTTPSIPTIQLQTSNTNDKTKPSTPPATVTHTTTTETKAVPFTSSTVQSANLNQGTTKVTIAGVNGVETLTYQVTLTNALHPDKQ